MPNSIAWSTDTTDTAHPCLSCSALGLDDLIETAEPCGRYTARSTLLCPYHWTERVMTQRSQAELEETLQSFCQRMVDAFSQDGRSNHDEAQAQARSKIQSLCDGIGLLYNARGPVDVDTEVDAARKTLWEMIKNTNITRVEMDAFLRDIRTVASMDDSMRGRVMMSRELNPDFGRLREATKRSAEETDDDTTMRKRFRDDTVTMIDA